MRSEHATYSFLRAHCIFKCMRNYTTAHYTCIFVSAFLKMQALACLYTYEEHAIYSVLRALVYQGHANIYKGVLHMCMCGRRLKDTGIIVSVQILRACNMFIFKGTPCI